MGYLKEGYLPEQISGTLAIVHPETPTLQVSHETIYTVMKLFTPAKGGMTTFSFGGQLSDYNHLSTSKALLLRLPQLDPG